MAEVNLYVIHEDLIGLTKEIRWDPDVQKFIKYIEPGCWKIIRICFEG